MSDVTRQDRDLTKVHPLLLPRLLVFFQEVGRRKLSVFITEAWRSPERQAWLYQSGRGREGRILTYAQPGQSYHNLVVYGQPFSAAVDVAVWDEEGGPYPKRLEWNGTAEEWEIVHAAAERAGLQTLSFEMPHLQLPYPLAELAAGRHWPANLIPPVDHTAPVPRTHGGEG